MIKHLPNALLAVAALSLAACGTNPGDRAVSGAGLGAASGIVVGAIVGAPLLGAAAIGAGAVALTGAVTNPKVINLGQPPWRDSR
jgi:hypothetical protein